ncbi:MAG: acyl carrier protein [Flavobacteriales bacterium]|nr:acyl carrier protein [Flavobacteriales bacterium]
MEDLKEKLKEQIIDRLNLEDVNVTDFSDDMPLFGGGLGLDSIDALELIVLLENDYGIELANPEEGKEIFDTINSLADYIQKNRK